ncbi:FABP family protein [Corynebacterium sp. 153RC1]|uniref:FABP family protein n=1 Tax=unclassified Corynebacterium TaxID=2624378 RepID=UPI00211C8506|nr:MULTISPECIES: FABP family protein [unclassified Corynebacterium]MCQ9353136.1 FABP family protein [Corynebacterium sp. 209RC1]MCQ9355340.1 FABP family protein [Corynebacterium sp. 1222RC1]MCQ9357722.1 FABP family protein [Corynebacterium sp. 122RC1]MCQ9359170.1 FABP family protein [Corynebacterium sp. 142RC1]MCQ9361874.1 FABP family protein [Corynebacterium sp. 153RC1]
MSEERNDVNQPDTNAESPAVSLSGSDQVAKAAEQWKESAHRNIPGLGDLPIPDDTANLREGPNLHDGLLALLPLVGVWRGTGQADTPEGGQFSFGQQLTFAHDGENYLTYESRTWRLDENGNSTGLEERETGFWRINLKDEIEVVAAGAAGVVEIYYGQPLNERAWELESASTMVTATGPTGFGPGKRLYGLMPNNNLGWVDERVRDGELTPRMSAELQRVIG